MIANILKIPKKKENNRKVQKIMNRRFTWTVNIPDLNSNQTTNQDRYSLHTFNW